MKRMQSSTKRSGMMNGFNAERIVTFDPEDSSAFERIVENVNVHVSKTKDQL